MTDRATRPLSYPELRHWFLSQWDNGTNAAYHNPVALRLRGPLRIDALRAALDALVRRHDILHTVYLASDDGIAARVVAPEPVALDVEDLTSVPPDEREAELSRRVGARALTPFRLDSGPLVRAHVFAVSPYDHVLLLLAHHIVVDGWSLNIVCQEIEALYGHAVRGKDVNDALPLPPVHYGEFAAAQLGGGDEAGLVEQVAYWRERLAGVAPVELPADRPRGLRPMEAGPLQELYAPAHVRDGVVALARRTRTTPFMVVLGALSTLLARLSGQTDVPIGCPSSARSRAEYPDVVGCFVNMLVFRTDVGGDPTFETLLSRVRTTATAAYGNQDVAFERLVTELRPQRERGRQPFYETTLTMHPIKFTVPSLLDIEVELYPFDLRMTFAELSLNVEVADDCLRGDVMYDAALFDPGTVADLSARFVSVLEGIVATPDVPVSSLPVLLERERARLAAWNETGTITGLRPAPETVLAQAARTPDAAAIVAVDATLTYAELVGRAAQLARRLRELGVGTDAVVGVLVPRTADLAVAVLGIMLSGGAYLPLDPTYPPDRLRFMLEDAQVGVVVTSGAAPDGVLGDGTRLVRLQEDRAALETLSSTPPDVVFHPESKAYVIYTSGSTGRPKGVVVEHRNVAALVEWSRRAYSPEELRLVAAPTSLCFDLSVYELFVPLSTGGAVLLVENALELAPDRCRATPTLVNSVPSAMEALVHVGGLPPSVRTVNVCGEPLSAKLLADLLDAPETTRVCNLYGPSEDTVYSTVAIFGPAPPQDGSGAPHIGSPITGTQAWVLDDAFELVPPGAPGELFLGGRGVARGYHALPALTAERYVPDPFGGEPGARLYRTGDIVRWRDDGVLEFLGRRDHQVKVRGHRIELAEIELCLLRHPRVREAVVVVTGATVGERALAAFVTLDGTGTGAGELERFVAERLPSYMVPQRIVVLDSLPRTPNGKVDRAALPTTTGPSEGGGDEPRTTTETALAAIWCTVLGVEAVGRDDDFFRLGGHSLLAIQVVARVRDNLGVELPLTVLFDERTLAAVAARIDASRPRRAPAKGVVRRGRTEGPLDWAQVEFVKDSSSSEVPAVATILRLTGSLDVAALEGALNEVGRRHEALRTAFKKSLGRHRQVVRPWEHLPLAPVVAGQKRQDGRRAGADQVIAELLTTPFDFDHGPLVRWVLLRRSKSEHVLAIAAHEVAADGWSVPIMLSELATFYADLVAGRAHTLPPPPVQYLDVVLRRRRALRRRARRREARYWKARLRDAPISLDLMPDGWPATEDCTEGRDEPLLLDRELSDTLRSLGTDEGCTLYMVLFAAFQAALHRWTAEPTVLLRATVANRRESDVEAVVGFLVNHVLVPTDVSGNPSLRELLARVRHEQLEITGHIEVPYHLTAGRAAAMRTAARGFWPRGRLRFQMLAFPHSSQLQLPGLRVEPESAPLAASEHFSMLGFEHPDRSVEFLLCYDSAWFERATAKRFLSLYRTILDVMVKDLDVKVDDVPVLDRRAAEAVLRAGRGQAHDPPFRAVHDLVAEQAQRAPNAAAVVCGERSLSYADLDGQADAVAAFVVEATTGPEARVVVAADGVEGVVGALGVLRAGALCIPAPVPGDQALVARIAEHARADLVVTNDDIACAATRRPTPRTPAIAGVVGEDSAAVALYCSGQGPLVASVLTHGALARAVLWRRTSTRVRKGERWGVLPAGRAGRAFTAVWSALASGATVVPAAGDVDDPWAWAAEQGLAVCSADGELVPALLEGATETKSPLRTVLTDEPVRAPEGRPRVHVEEAVSLPEAAGPVLTSGACRSAQAPAFVGRSTPGTQALVLDASLEPAPPGVPGELFVDASHLGRGYLDDPRATACRFVPNPWSGRPGSRMVATGMLARVVGHDSIEVLGPVPSARMRGLPIARYAVPLEEAVRAHPGVAGAFVRVETMLGEPRFVVYVVRRRGARVSGREVRALVPAYFPVAARPGEVVFVDRFPRTLDGRIDIGALGARRKPRR